MNKFIALSFILLASTKSFSIIPFETCPSEAYLFQGNPVQVYGVNLVTGETTILAEETGINGNINSVGFNEKDRYIYGYDTTNFQIVRLGKHFQVENLNVTGLPNHIFFVGDIYEHVLYLYYQNKGLFKISLYPLDFDPSANLIIETITTTATVALTDFAFHPINGKLYGVDNNTGGLYEFDTQIGGEKYLGNVGITGTFGAGYFDSNGYYYISRNDDGYIFRINLADPSNINHQSIKADVFSYGPSSSQNDGARCANAPIINQDSTIDFGDAPNSYSTLLESNGPRHGIGSEFYLGLLPPDGEKDGSLPPLNDNKVGELDEDGVGFVTAIEPGMNSIISVQASRSGYLSAWIDWNKDGDFKDSGEKVFSDTYLLSGNNSLLLAVPYNIATGSTWSRFRFSDQTGIDFFGGAQKGEVEDHTLLITNDGFAIRHYPNESGYITVAFEDNWPYTADYDMNDLVVRYRVTESLKDGKVKSSIIQGYLAAYGASYRNGFAIRLAGLNRTDIDNSLTLMKHNGILQESNGLETLSDEAIFIVSEDMSDVLSENCEYFRTQQSCQETLKFSFELHIFTHEDADTSQLMSMPYNPFIFSTPGHYHGDGIIFQPGRKLEVHVADQAPTEKFDYLNLFGIGVDSSNPSEGRYFKTAENLPWALIINNEWKWPQERVDLVTAYPNFAAYAESGGQKKQNWYLESNAVANQLYQP
ncbi:LruC domain-containing protein [Candidatus Photodesmus blepharus]|nr:LruC domain-containing protein [Candidatus Photodesmus blepharus]